MHKVVVKKEADITEEASVKEPSCCNTAALTEEAMGDLNTNYMMKEEVDDMGIETTSKGAIYHVIKEEVMAELECRIAEPTCCDSTGTDSKSEAAMLDGLYTNHMIKEEAVAGPECMNTEPTCSDSTDDTSNAAMLDALYTNHVIKEEVVLGPESIQRPNMPYGCASEGVVTGPSSTYCELSNSGDSSSSEYELDTQTTNIHTRLQDDTPVSKLDIQTTKAHRCQICQKIFKSPSALKAHVQVHDKNRVIVKNYSCQPCQRYFARFTQLRMHMQRHYKVKPVCRLCNKQYALWADLRIHERIHTRENLLTCDICKKEFTERKRLNSHLLVHSTNLYSCDICNKQFKRLPNLKIHKNTKHEIIPIDD